MDEAENGVCDEDVWNVPVLSDVCIGEIESLCSVEEYGYESARDAYCVLKSSTRCLEYSDRLYELYVAVFARILGVRGTWGIVADAVGMGLENILEFGLVNAVIENVICNASRVGTRRHERLVEELCGKMTTGLLQEVLGGDLEDDLMNIKLDFIVLSLKLIVMFVEERTGAREEISRKGVYGFAREYFYESLVYFNEVGELENDVVFIFRTTFSIDVLVTGKTASRVGEVFSIVGDLLVSEENLFKIYVQITKTSVHDGNAFNDLLFLVFTTDCLVSLELGHRNKFIGMVVSMVGAESGGDTMETFRRIFHNLRDSELGNRDAFVWNFLSFLSRLKLPQDVGDINNIFLRFVVRHPETIELYSDFILLNDIDVPLHSLHQSSNFGFVRRFYGVLFNKVRKERHNISHVDRLIVEFLKFFLATKSKDIIGILPLVPYLPTRRETLHALYEIYAFLFEKEAMEHVGLFLLKTPALVGVSSSIYYNVKYFPQLATQLGVTDVDAQRLVFLGVVYYCESKKIHNFNYTGMLEYISDEDTIRTARKGLIHVVEQIHNNYVSRSYEFTLSYVRSLLEIGLEPRTTETTLVLIEVILRRVLEKEEKIVFIKEIHQRFQELFGVLGRKKFLSTEVVESYVELYRRILERIRCAPNFYNYVVLCLADLSFFDGDFQTHRFRSFNELYSHTLSRIGVIEGFPDIFTVGYKWDGSEHGSGDREYVEGDEKSGEAEMGIVGGEDGEPRDMYDIIHTGVNESTMSLATTGSIALRSSENVVGHVCRTDIERLNMEIKARERSVSWLIDVIYIRRNESSTIRMVLDLLKLRLEDMFEYEDLYILLKAYNILLIRENDSEKFLKQALHKGLDFKTDAGICYKLSLETSGFYRFFFKTLYFAVAGPAAFDSPGFPEKGQLVPKFNTRDLILIQNMFKQKVTYKILRRSNMASYRCYFFDLEELSVMDCITVIRRVDDPFVASMALERLRSFKKEIFFYVPQLVQALRHGEMFEGILDTLKELAREGLVSHQLMWNLKANLYRDEKKSLKDERHDVFVRCMEEIMCEMSPENRMLFEREEEVIGRLTGISSSLMEGKSSKDEKRRRINEQLGGIRLSPGVYIPYSPEQKIVEVVSGSARVLQSHAKVPFMASFKVQDMHGQTSIKQAIFKFGDDCRQDMLALQLISMFRSIFEQANLDIFLYPYKVIATDTGCGIIEVIPNSKSRDQIGRENINNLCEYFEYKFGFKESEEYLTALYNFASSLAGYSLVVYFLNIKDRHNGNIMIDDKGRMIHIDFGYMLETSPGNLNIEAPLKLTREIEELLGGTSGKGFRIYQELMVKGFLALRRRSKELVMMVDSFVESELSCYKSSAVENFILRFRFELSDKSARTFILSLIAESSQKFRTWMYDQYQKLTNNIAF